MIYHKKLLNNVYSINTGMATSFLIIDKINVLIDTGDIHYSNRLLETLNDLQIKDKLDYIFLTHAHHDHCGGLRNVSRETNAKVMIFSPDDIWLSKGINCDLNPYKIKGKLASLISKDQDYDWSYNADIIINQDTYLDKTIDLKAIALPGHTKGSGGILYGDNLFCGDLYTSYIPNHYGAPFFVYNEVAWKDSCKKANEISNILLPSHGRMLNAN